MFEETKKGFDWFSLIVGVLFIIAGIASFTRPDKTLHFLAIVAGIAFIFRGIYELWFRQRIGRILGESSGWLIFSAIFLFQPSFGVLFIAIIFAIWFILDSITELISAKFFKEFHRGYYWFIIILAILSLVLGVILLFSPLLSAITVVWLVSTFLIVFGIMKLIQAF